MALPAWKAWIADAEAEAMADRKLRRVLSPRAIALLTPGRRSPRGARAPIGDRRIIAEGLEHGFWKDFYFNAMTASWPTFFGALAAGFVALNCCSPASTRSATTPIANARPGSFADLFFFSVETTSTVGYGDMHPQTLYGHVVATAENFVGLMLLAMMTGLMFARFSRPRARLIFARNPVIAEHDGRPTLIFSARQRPQQLHLRGHGEALDAGPDGHRGRAPIRRLPADAPDRNENPAFALSWTLFHPIDPTARSTASRRTISSPARSTSSW